MDCTKVGWELAPTSMVLSVSSVSQRNTDTVPEPKLATYSFVPCRATPHG